MLCMVQVCSMSKPSVIIVVVHAATIASAPSDGWAFLAVPVTPWDVSSAPAAAKVGCACWLPSSSKCPRTSSLASAITMPGKCHPQAHRLGHRSPITPDPPGREPFMMRSCARQKDIETKRSQSVNAC